MFTGLIQRIGTVKRISRGAGLVLEIAADEDWAKPLEEGESVAVNGVCLTVVKCDGSRFTADVLRETESRTGLAELVPGAKVNLERAYAAIVPLFSKMGADKADLVMRFGKEYLDLFPEGKNRTEISNCMNKAKADLPAK